MILALKAVILAAHRVDLGGEVRRFFRVLGPVADPMDKACREEENLADNRAQKGGARRYM